MENKDKIAQKMIENGITQITILEGQAPPQPEIYNPTSVEISGAIDSPLRFITERKDEIDFKKSYVIAKKGAKIITLIINEQSVVDKYTIDGVFNVSTKFQSLRINEEHASYTPEKLAHTLKLLRSIFTERADHAKIVSTLKNIKAKINRKIENADDSKGNVTRNFTQEVESNMPDGFKLKMPLFEGEEPKEFEVNVVLEADGGSSIKCLLESVEAAELMDEIVEERFNAQIEELQKSLLEIEA